VKRIPLHCNYERACLRLHVVAVHLGHVMMLIGVVFTKRLRPVGAMVGVVPLFWGAVVFFFAANFASQTTAAGASLPGPRDALWCLAQSVGTVSALFITTSHALIATAYFYSSPSRASPPGTRMKLH
jgi:hypothetical protein